MGELSFALCCDGVFTALLIESSQVGPQPFSLSSFSLTFLRDGCLALEREELSRSNVPAPLPSRSSLFFPFSAISSNCQQ